MHVSLVFETLAMILMEGVKGDLMDYWRGVFLFFLQLCIIVFWFEDFMDYN